MVSPKDSANTLNDAQLAIATRLEASLNRRRWLAAVQETDLLQRLEAVEICRQNSFIPAWTSIEHPAGGRMEIIITEEVSRQAYLFGAFEEELSLYILSVLRPGDVFFDAGAHYGYFSLLASALVGETGHVVAFEPHPETLDRLQRNVAGRPNISVEAKAIWSGTQEISFAAAAPAFSAFSSVIGLRHPEQTAPVERIQVDAISIDDYVRERAIQPTFIKLDVESAEMQAILGAERTLREARPILSVEVGDFDHLLAQGVPTSLTVLKILAAAGYGFRELIDRQLRPHVLIEDRPYPYANIIAVPLS